jgi:hypothetical protein
MVFGVWCLVFGVWCLVFGVWFAGDAGKLTSAQAKRKAPFRLF